MTSEKTQKNEIWTAKSEYSRLVGPKTPISRTTHEYLKRWINITLLRDDAFFKKYLTEKEYIEFNEKVKNYTDVHGYENENSCLYFVVYGFSQELEDKLLNLRNIYGVYLITLILFPYEMVHNNTILADLMKDFTKIDKVRSYRLRNLLQEIAFDMGCSSQALGRLNHYIDHMFLQSEPTNNISGETVTPMNSETFSKINLNIMDLYTGRGLETPIDLTPTEKALVNIATENGKRYVPVNFAMSNKIFMYFVRQKIGLPTHNGLQFSKHN